MRLRPATPHPVPASAPAAPAAAPSAQIFHLPTEGIDGRLQRPTAAGAAAAQACGTSVPTLAARRPKQTQTTVPGCPGLVRVTYPSGRSTWFFDFVDPNSGKRTKVRIGPANAKSARPASRTAGRKAAGSAAALCTDDATAKAEAMREGLSRGISPAQVNLSFGEFVVGLYVDACQRAGKRSLRDDLSRARKHLLPLLADLMLRAIHKRQLVNLLERLTQLGMSPATRNRIAALLRAIFACALEQGLIAINPAADLPWLPENPPAPTTFTPEELARLGEALKVASEILQVFVGIASTTAMRCGEVQNLKWEDIDYEAGEILLPVTKSGRPQKVPLTAAVRAYLDVAAGWRRDGNPHVFPRPRACTPLPVPRKEWHETLARASLPKQGFHTLRRAWATQGAYLGLPVITISRGLRHAAISTTERHYLATRRDEQHAAASQVGDLLRTAMGAGPADPSPSAAAA